MCMFCAAIPAAAAVGAKLNADQKRKQAENETPERPLPIAALTGGVIVALLAGSAAYHTLTLS